MNTKKCWLDFAETIDAFRVIPRLILVMYGIFLYHISEWFMALVVPTTQQSAFISAMVGILPILVSTYSNSSRKWKDKE